MLNIIERLDRSRFAPAVCVEKKGGALDRVVERMGIPFIEAPFTLSARPYRSLLHRAQAAAEVFKPYRFDLWHSFHYLDDYTEALIARAAGAKWVYTKKNMNWHRRSWHLRSLLASGIAAQNSDMRRDFFASPLYRRKTQLIPRGVNTDKFSPEAQATLGLRQSYGLGPEAVAAGCVAHLVPVKGHPTLLQATARVPQLHLFIAGRPMDKEYAGTLRQLAADLGIANRVHFLGGVDEVPGFYREMDIAVLPTWAKWRQEGCPVALLEAMACGKACIATDIPGSRDLVVDGCSGLIVPPEDAEAMGGGLARLARAPEFRLGLGAAARQQVLEHYDIAREVKAHEDFYQWVLGR